MIFNSQIIEKLKEKSGLSFDKSKDFECLCDKIFQQTGRTIGLTTIKRLMGYISDNRHTNVYTLNTVGIYLGYPSWEEPIECKISIKYLNRDVTFKVVLFKEEKMLQVLAAQNSSLKEGDILEVTRLKIGEFLEAKRAYRGDSIGNFRTNGELKDVKIE